MKNPATPVSTSRSLSQTIDAQIGALVSSESEGESPMAVTSVPDMTQEQQAIIWLDQEIKTIRSVMKIYLSRLDALQSQITVMRGGK